MRVRRRAPGSRRNLLPRTDEREHLVCRFRNIGAGPKNRGHTGAFEKLTVLRRNNATYDHKDVVRAQALQRFDQLRHERLVTSGLARHSDLRFPMSITAMNGRGRNPSR
jgi:hypothetical protein